MVATPYATGAAQSSTGAVTSTISRDASIGDNDMLLAWVSTQGAITTPSGWTSLGTTTTPPYNKSALFWRRAGAGVTQYSFSTSTGHAVNFLGIPGAADPVAGEYQITATQTATCNVGQANSWAFSFTSLGTSGTATPTGTDTVRDSRSGAFSSVKIQNLVQDSNGAVATGTATRTFSGTSNVNSVASAIVVLRSSGNSYTRTISDTIGISDAVTRTVVYNRSFADAIGVTDKLYGPAATGTYDLYPTSPNPAPSTSFGGAGFALGLHWRVTGLGKRITAIKSYVQPAAGSPLTATLWQGSTLALLASATVPGTPVADNTWTVTPLTSPVTLDPTEFYIVSIYYPNGGPLGPAGLPATQGPLTPISAAYASGDVVPTATLADQSYAITPVVTDMPVAGPEPGRRLLLAA